MKDRLARIPAFDVLFRMLDRYRLDAADQFAAAIGLFVFLALVPVFLLLVAAAGFVFAAEADQVALAEGVASTVPGLGATLGGGEGVEGFVTTIIDRRGAITGAGIVGLLLTALRPVNAAMTACVTVFRAPLPQGMGLRGRQVLASLLLATVAVGAVGTSTLVGFASLHGFVRFAVSILLTYALDVLLFWTGYRFLTPGSRLGGRALLPGALVAAVGWTGLKVAGSAYIGNQIESADALYGAVGGVVALLLLLYLGARLFLYGAELAAVLYERRHGPIPLPTGTTALARIDDPLPDGTYVTAPGGTPRRRPVVPRRVERRPGSARPAGDRGAASTSPDRPGAWPAPHVDAPSGDGPSTPGPSRVAVVAAGLAGLAVVYRLARGSDPS